MAKPPDVRGHVLSWFTADELKHCPYCGEHAAVPTAPGPSVCLRCEVVWIEEAGRPAEQSSVAPTARKSLL